jgi:hypothetical protein
MTQKKKLFIFNCPPKAGKDSSAEVLMQMNPTIQHIEFKSVLFEIALTVSRIPEDEWFDRYNIVNPDGTLKKDEPWDRLNGLSQRQFLIKISEEWVKPTFGDDYFGQAVARDIESYPADFFIATDGGFDSEVKPVADSIGADNVHVLQWSREGCSYDGDSRNYLSEACGAGSIVRIEDNNTTLEDHADRIITELSSQGVTIV